MAMQIPSSVQRFPKEHSSLPRLAASQWTRVPVHPSTLPMTTGDYLSHKHISDLFIWNSQNNIYTTYPIQHMANCSARHHPFWHQSLSSDWSKTDFCYLGSQLSVQTARYIWPMHLWATHLPQFCLTSGWDLAHKLKAHANCLVCLAKIWMNDAVFFPEVVQKCSGWLLAECQLFHQARCGHMFMFMLLHFWPRIYFSCFLWPTNCEWFLLNAVKWLSLFIIVSSGLDAAHVSAWTLVMQHQYHTEVWGLSLWIKGHSSNLYDRYDKAT